MDLTRLVQTFLAEAIGSEQRPFPSHTFVVGVSGGTDSLALLHVLTGLVDRHRLVVAHLNHGWRDTAVTDAQFVAHTAASWGLACVVETVDVVTQARASSLSLEEAGRQARYRLLARLARESAATAVLVAHNADDQAETVLLNLLRGAGLTGLAGMRSVAAMPGAADVVLLRPFLTVSRAAIQAYCRDHALTPVEDSTNLDTTFRRNRLRHDLMPQLAAYNPQIQARLQQLADLAAADDACLEGVLAERWLALVADQAESWLALDRARWLDLPLALKRRSLRRALLALRPSLANVGYLPIEQARQVAEKGEVGAQSALADGLWLRVDYGRLLITHDPHQPPGDWPQIPPGAVLPLPVPGVTMLANGWRMEAERLEGVDLDAVSGNIDPWNAYLDVAQTALWVRGRQPGERFTPLGLHGRSTTLKEVMVNRKIGAAWRSNWPLVCSDEHVLWLVGHQISEQARVTLASGSVVRVHCYKS